MPIGYMKTDYPELSVGDFPELKSGTKVWYEVCIGNSRAIVTHYPHTEHVGQERYIAINDVEPPRTSWATNELLDYIINTPGAVGHENIHIETMERRAMSKMPLSRFKELGMQEWGWTVTATDLRKVQWGKVRNYFRIYE